MNIVLNDELASIASSSGFTSFDQTSLKKSIEWKTEVVKYDGGAEQRNQLFEWPVRHWFLNWAILNIELRNELIRFFQRARGRYNTFYFIDETDDTCSLAEGTCPAAAGGETTTQLVKKYYPNDTETWTENKYAIKPSAKFAPVIKLAGVTKTEGTHFTLNDTTGVINWAAGTAPNGALTTGQIVTANYEFYFRVRFADDTYLDRLVYPNIYEQTDLEIVEVYENP